MKCSIVADERHFPAINHDTRAGFGLARHLNDVPVLDQRIHIERQIDFFLGLDDDGETIFLALHRLLAGCVIRFDRPIVGAYRQARDNHARRFHLAVEQQRGKIGIVRNAKTVPGSVGHGRPGEFDFLRLFSGIDEDRHHVARRNWRGRPDLGSTSHGFRFGLETHLFPTCQVGDFSVTLDVATTFLHQDLVLVIFGIVVNHRRGVGSERSFCSGYNHLRFRTLNVGRSR